MQENVMSAKSIYVEIVTFWDGLEDMNPTSCAMDVVKKGVNTS
jgi:hypothetical protein